MISRMNDRPLGLPLHQTVLYGPCSTFLVDSSPRRVRRTALTTSSQKLASPVGNPPLLLVEASADGRSVEVSRYVTGRPSLLQCFC